MKKFVVQCADRNTGAEYPIEVVAADPRTALMQAASAGHITSTVLAAPDVMVTQAPPPPPEVFIQREMLDELKKLRASNQELASITRKAHGFNFLRLIDLLVVACLIVSVLMMHQQFFLTMLCVVPFWIGLRIVFYFISLAIKAGR